MGKSAQTETAVLPERYRGQQGKAEVRDFPVTTERSTLISSLNITVHVAFILPFADP